jgi:hypothetical protein
VVVSGTVLLSQRHAPREEVEPDTPSLRRLAEVRQPGRQLGSLWTPVVAAEADDDEPVRRLPGLVGLLQKVVIFFYLHREKAEIEETAGRLLCLYRRGKGRKVGVQGGRRRNGYRRSVLERSWLSSKWASGTGSVRGRLPVQVVRRLWAWTQGRLQEQPGHRYFHGCSSHSSQRDTFPPPELELAALFASAPRSYRSSSIANGAAGDSAGRFMLGF